jgi:hypothetical protein
MIDYLNCNIEQVSVHQVGNKINGENLLLSKSAIKLNDLRLRELLFKYFINSFKDFEFYNFTFSNQDFTLNPLYIYSSTIFSNPTLFHTNSINIVKHLYETSIHPQIKSGDFFVVYFSNFKIGDDSSDAIGLFKSENRQSFLKLDIVSEEFNLSYEDGINIEKADKGCIIFDINKSHGYKVCIFDKSNKSIEAQYWRDKFLQLSPCDDEFHLTKDFLEFTRNFITKELPKDFEISKAEKIDLLNRSVTYFKSHNTFEKKEFTQEVLNNTEIIKSFDNFCHSYNKAFDHEISETFEISEQAVKKQSKIFKSVLKLDKNFHIYIHGDKDLIERGIENDGRKFYKIYFNNEE